MIPLRAALLALALLAPVAAAQTQVNPIQGGYADVYLVTGRIIDPLGTPVARVPVTVELEQKGVRAAPLSAATDCFGVFIVTFNLREVRPDGKVRVAYRGPEGAAAVGEADLDPFYRRSDLKLRYEGQWTDPGCPEQTKLWESRVTITGRALARVDPYEVEGVTLHARPETGQAELWYWPDNGTRTCPASRADATRCDFSMGVIDERGDFRYSWVFENAFDLDGDERIEVIVANKSHNFTLDREWRVASGYIETTGRGPPPVETPGAPLAAVVLTLALVALLRRGRA